MRVLHIITGLGTGGAERFLHRLLTEGLRKRQEPSVLSLTKDGDLGESIRNAGIPVFSLGMKARKLPFYRVARLREILRTSRPELVQGWMYHGNLAACISRCLTPLQIPLAWNVRHSLYDLEREKFLTRQVIQANRLLSERVDGIIYNSEVSRRQHETFGFAQRRTVVIPNGFDTERLRPDLAKRRELRQSWGIPTDATVVGHVARFHPMKNHGGFFRAAVPIAQKNPNVRFVLIGREVTPDNPALSRNIPKELNHKFLLLGQRVDATELLKGMDVFCQSSSWGEAFPNALGEAMATAVPCVATDVGDTATMVGDTGVIVQPEDNQALVRGLSTMLTKSADERGQLGERARARIQERYALPRIVDRYTELYEELLSSHRGEGSL